MRDMTMNDRECHEGHNLVPRAYECPDPSGITKSIRLSLERGPGYIGPDWVLLLSGSSRLVS